MPVSCVLELHQPSTAYPMEQERHPKWRATVTADLPSAAADDAWSLVSSFCGLQRWLPSLGACHRVAGVEDAPGCVRYCTTAGEDLQWATEELLSSDPAARSYTYKINDSNMGFGEYVATFAVVPASGDSGISSRIEWSFEADPVKGWTEEGLVTFIRTCAEGMAEKIEEALGVPAAGADDDK